MEGVAASIIYYFTPSFCVFVPNINILPHILQRTAGNSIGSIIDTANFRGGLQKYIRKSTDRIKYTV